MSDKKQNPTFEKVKNAVRNTVLTTGVIMATTVAAHAEDATASIDLTTGLAGVAVVGGIIASGGLKAVPTYVAWGVRKALSMLR